MLPERADSACETVTGWVKRAAVEALGDYKTPEPLSDRPEPERRRLQSHNRKIATAASGVALQVRHAGLIRWQGPVVF
jgi:hypothetical protein